MAIAAILAALAPVAAAGIGGLFGNKGQKDANQANRESADKQMEFQREMATNAQSFSERMANTAVQRSVADYTAAGLNPALAYERSASAPTGVMAGGASSTSQNTLTDLAQLSSTAMGLKQMNEDLKTAKAQRYKIMQDADLAFEQKMEVQRARNFNKVQEPATARRQHLDNMFLELGLPGARNEAKMETTLDKFGGSASSRLFLEFLRGISGAMPRRKN